MNIKKLFSWLHILSTIAPIILTLIPGIPNALIPTIIKAIQEAEKLGGSGEDKRDMVLKATKEEITELNTSKDYDIKMVDTLDQVGKGIDKVITTTNLIHMGH